MKYLSQSQFSNRRVIVDECVSLKSELFLRFSRENAARAPIKYVFLSKEHRAVPDDLILTQLLGPDTILLTTDRVLHNRACQAGFESHTLDETGQMVCKPLDSLPTQRPPTAQSGVLLKSDYVHPGNPIATACKAGLTEKDFQRDRTRRRRIRSYFGSEQNLGKVSLTIGSERTARGLISGFFLAIAGNHGKKGISASEGYAVPSAMENEPAHCLLHAVREVYILQLEQVPIDLYVIPETSYQLAHSLLSDPTACPESTVHQALRTCLHGLAAVTVHRCVKGPFHDAMKSKLKQVASPRSNEVVATDYRLLIQALNPLPTGKSKRTTISTTPTTASD